MSKTKFAKRSLLAVRSKKLLSFLSAVVVVLLTMIDSSSAQTESAQVGSTETEKLPTASEVKSPREEQASAAGSMNQLFDEAIASAQQKTVKVYGATVGRVEGYGTGIIVSPEGHIVTANGVYLTGYRVRVGLNDGSIHEATLLQTDRERQLALLKIETETTGYFELSSEPVGQKGDWVVTFSNAFKVANGDEPMSVNLGIITLRTFIEAMRSERDVAYRGSLVLIDAITSNPGAAGGAVVTVDGQLVGMIGKDVESNDTNTRLNYAVPSDILLKFKEGTLDEAGSQTASNSEEPSKPADLGLRMFGLNGPRSPAYVDRVNRGGPAFKARVRPDDLVISLNGEKVNSIRDYQSILKTLHPGKMVVLVVKRGEELVRLEVTPVEKE